MTPILMGSLDCAWPGVASASAATAAPAESSADAPRLTELLIAPTSLKLQSSLEDDRLPAVYLIALARQASASQPLALLDRPAGLSQGSGIVPAKATTTTDREESTQMKAAYLEQFGGAEVLNMATCRIRWRRRAKWSSTSSLPALTPPTGSSAPAIMPATPKLNFRIIPGRDFSGVVSAAGGGVDLAVGDAVFGVLDAGREGTYCEKLAIKAAIIAKKPDGLSHVNAAALALTGLTAMNSVEDTLKLKRGETILF